MDIQYLLTLLVIGAVCGWLAGQIVRGYGFGLVGNVVVGALGSFIVGYALPVWLHVALPAIGTSWILNAIVWGTIGAVVLLLLVGMVRRRA
ncbi:MAG TPA: GlsB/YeaQ/YmgE family stress response membrane protein [Allosphingosinicella sp.]|nr:GlsB/YeaQ/YmgE family stress response membrane protein [Allosphingosinicella sp.]